MKNTLTSLSEFIDTKVGKKGTKKRDKFEAEYAFKLGVLFNKPDKKKELHKNK